MEPIRIKSCITYGLVALLATLVFSLFSSITDSTVIAGAYMPFVLLSAISGYFFGGWYIIRKQSSFSFEVLLAPVCVFLISAFMSGIVFGVLIFAANHFVEPASPLKPTLSELLRNIGYGIYSGIYFLAVVAVLIYPLGCISGMWLVRHQKGASEL